MTNYTEYKTYTDLARALIFKIGMEENVAEKARYLAQLINTHDLIDEEMELLEGLRGEAEY